MLCNLHFKQASKSRVSFPCLYRPALQCRSEGYIWTVSFGAFLCIHYFYLLFVSVLNTLNVLSVFLETILLIFIQTYERANAAISIVFQAVVFHKTRGSFGHPMLHLREIILLVMQDEWFRTTFGQESQQFLDGWRTAPSTVARTPFTLLCLSLCPLVASAFFTCMYNISYRAL